MVKSISKALIDSLDERKGTVITEREMKALKRRWGPHFVKDHNIPVNAEYEAFEAAAPFLVSIDQTAKGLAYLNMLVFTSSGAVRKNLFVRDNMNEYRIAVLRNFDRFEFVDWEFMGESPHYQWPFPMYRVVAKNGDSFVYTARSWQSGGSIVA